VKNGLWVFMDIFLVYSVPFGPLDDWKAFCGVRVVITFSI
jgi:hypothetical protein